MLGALKPSGVLAIGDVFLRAPLPEVAAECEGVGRGDYRTLEQSAAVLERHGLALEGLIAASEDDWDRYASGSWRAARSWAASNPEAPDRAEILSLTDEFRKRHLRFTRPHLGWAMCMGGLWRRVADKIRREETPKGSVGPRYAELRRTPSRRS